MKEQQIQKKNEATEKESCNLCSVHKAKLKPMFWWEIVCWCGDFVNCTLIWEYYGIVSVSLDGIGTVWKLTF
jgi:hypothetical protein